MLTLSYGVIFGFLDLLFEQTRLLIEWLEFSIKPFF